MRQRIHRSDNGHAADWLRQWHADIDRLVQAMQTQAHTQACERLLAMTSEALGCAAVEGARERTQDGSGESSA